MWTSKLLEIFKGLWLFQAQVTRQNAGLDKNLTIKKLDIYLFPYVN